jgi:ABC-type uncharacterized transport system substrate-binding protein
MKKTLLSTIVVAMLGIATVAYPHSHFWQKIESRESNGQIICTWKCSMDPMNVHHTTTSGYGICPNP